MAKIMRPGLALVILLMTSGLAAWAQEIDSALGQPLSFGLGSGPPVVSTLRKGNPFVPQPHLENAFEEFETGHLMPFWYASVGPMALARGSLGSTVVATFDPGVAIPGLPTFFDHGNPAPADAPVAARLDMVPADFRWGAQGTIGWQFGPHAFEFTGFYIPRQTSRAGIDRPSQLNLPFAESPFPLGFEGNNNMWLQADHVGLSFESALGSAEFNYRLAHAHWLEWIAGVRYVDLRERLGIFTDDDGLTVDPPDPFRMATVESLVHSRMIGPQFGFQTQYYVIPSGAIGLANKYMIAANYFEVDNRLFRGDGFEGPGASRSDWRLSGLIELNAFAHIWLNHHMRLVGGYQTMWILNTPAAQRQVSFDTANPGAAAHDRSTIFFHGPRLELQVAW